MEEDGSGAQPLWAQNQQSKARSPRHSRAQGSLGPAAVAVIPAVGAAGQAARPPADASVQPRESQSGSQPGKAVLLTANSVSRETEDAVGPWIGCRIGAPRAGHLPVYCQLEAKWVFLFL